LLGKVTDLHKYKYLIVGKKNISLVKVAFALEQHWSHFPKFIVVVVRSGNKKFGTKMNRLHS